MLATRMLDANVYYFLTSGYIHKTQDWALVKVKAGYPKSDLDIIMPQASLVRGGFTSSDFELGENNIDRRDIYNIHLFCLSDSQGDDLAEYTKNLFFDTSKNFLDYNDGYPPLTGQAVLGKIYFEFINMSPIRNSEFQDRAGKHRMNVRIGARFVDNLT